MLKTDIIKSSVGGINMAVRNIEGLTASARKWIIASYAFNAKIKIDSLSYIAKYHRKIPTGAARNMIEPLYLDFFIECSAVLDNHIDIISTSRSNEKTNRNRLNEYPEVEEIYHWRDKFAAHHDLDALGFGLNGSFNDWKEHIEHMKHLLDTVVSICRKNIPSSFKLDYLVHDAISYRLVNRIDRAKEEQIYDMQHPLRHMGENDPNGVSYTAITSVDDACRYLRTKNVLAQPNRVCGLFETGINKEETLQNLQRSCIINNVLYDMDMWVSKGETYDDELLEALNTEIIKRVTVD